MNTKSMMVGLLVGSTSFIGAMDPFLEKLEEYQRQLDKDYHNAKYLLFKCSVLSKSQPSTLNPDLRVKFGNGIAGGLRLVKQEAPGNISTAENKHFGTVDLPANIKLTVKPKDEVGKAAKDARQREVKDLEEKKDLQEGVSLLVALKTGEIAAPAVVAEEKNIDLVPSSKAGDVVERDASGRLTKVCFNRPFRLAFTSLRDMQKNKQINSQESYSIASQIIPRLNKKECGNFITRGSGPGKAFTKEEADILRKNINQPAPRSNKRKLPVQASSSNKKIKKS